MTTLAAKPFKTGLKQVFLYVALCRGGNEMVSLTRPLCPGLKMS